MGISVIINVVDEEAEYLPQSLTSIRRLADEIIIIDMTFGNEVRALANEYEAKRYPHERVAYVELIRNYGIEKAKNEWILILDPDEVIEKPLAQRLKELEKSTTTTFYRLPRKNIIFGKWVKHSRWWPDHNIRFFKKGAVTWDEVIHAVPMTSGQGRDLEAKEDNAIVHYHYSTIEQYITRMNRYTTVQARILVNDGYILNWKDFVRKPVNEFLSRYFFGKGYKDGLHGLSLSGLQALSEFVTYLKVWQLNKFSEEQVGLRDAVDALQEAGKDINYWKADTLIKEGAGFTQRIRRKFKL